MTNIIEIVPAILSQNLADAENKIKLVEPYVRRVQIDIMDGEFVPNKTLSISEYASVKTPLIREVQLMVKEPEKYIDDCVRYGIDLVEFHLESNGNIWHCINKAKLSNLKVGIALKPETPLEWARQYLKSVDLVLLMSVNPGAGGQEFIPQTLERIRMLRAMWPNGIIEIDGGVKQENIEAIINAGANFLVVGTGIYNTENPKSTLKNIQKMIS